MAKKSKDLQHSKEQQFDELIQNNWYFNEVYTYLLKFENEYTNISLMDFIINCESATSNVLMALLNQSNNKDLTIKYIIEQRGYYETSIKPDYLTNYKLNDFELYLTKFIVAHCLVKYYKEDKKRTDYFSQVLGITKGQNNTFKYYFDYHRGYFCTGSEWGVCADWHLRLNTKQYVTIDKKELAETLNKLKQIPNQTEPNQTKIKPIKWLKNSNLLAYLINELKTYGFIDEDSIWAICEQIFLDKKGLPIKAQTFTSMVKNYEAITMYDEKGNPTTKKGKPKTHTEITELIKTLKALSKEIE